MILVGTALLMLPAAHAEAVGAPWIVALFTAVSAVCVTGLVTVDTGTYWSPFGQWVIMALFQIGGFGMMTAATLLGLLVNRSFRLRMRLTAQAETHTLGIGDVTSVAKLVLLATLIVEAIAALALTLRLRTGYDLSWAEAGWSGLFHAVSAFNNAGFSIHADGLMRYASDGILLAPIMLAIVIGGLGFPVLHDLRRKFRDPRHWSVHTKLTLVGTAVLLAGGTLLLLAFLHRRIRAVGPLVLAFMVVAVAGSQLAVGLAGQSEATLRRIVELGSLLGLGGAQIFWGLMLAGALLAAVIGWQALKWLGRRHVTRRSSDQMLTLDALWLLFAVVQTLSFAFEGLAWLTSGAIAFAAWKLVTTVGFRLAGLGRAQGAAPSLLLLLRVFALGARSERLFDGLGKRWLRIGSIDMIAGPDLVTTAVEPHEFLDFVGGRLSRQFVRDEPDLARRFAARALGPDPDGRHRVNEFFCHDDTWRPTMLRLAQAADVVLMDLRGFAPHNQGCRYELQQLLDHVPLERVLVLVDADAPRGFIEETVASLWQAARPDSPNRHASEPRLRLLDDQGEATVARLTAALAGALGPSRPVQG